MNNNIDNTLKHFQALKTTSKHKTGHIHNLCHQEKALRLLKKQCIPDTVSLCFSNVFSFCVCCYEALID